MPRHQFTPDERSRGGKTRSQQESFKQMCENGYQMLQMKRPGVAMWVYEQRIKPAMQELQKKRGNA